MNSPIDLHDRINNLSLDVDAEDIIWCDAVNTIELKSILQQMLLQIQRIESQGDLRTEARLVALEDRVEDLEGEVVTG